MIKKLETGKAPLALGPYSQGVVLDSLIFVSGQVPIDPDSNSIVENDIAIQTRQAIKNIEQILVSAGSSLEKVLKTTIFIKNMKEFPRVNDEYAKFFTGPTQPARSAVEVSALPKGALIEIEAIAYL